MLVYGTIQWYGICPLMLISFGIRSMKYNLWFHNFGEFYPTNHVCLKDSNSILSCRALWRGSYISDLKCCIFVICNIILIFKDNISNRYTFIDVITSINTMENMECMYENVSDNVTFSGIHRNTQIIVMW